MLNVASWYAMVLKGAPEEEVGGIVVLEAWGTLRDTEKKTALIK